MNRLVKFWKSYNTFDSKQHTLQAVQKMYGLPLTAYPDLEKTGEELSLLQTLYDLYQKFIEFDETFKDTLWQDVNLEQSKTEVCSHWLGFQYFIGETIRAAYLKSWLPWKPRKVYANFKRYHFP